MSYLSLYRKWRPQTFADVVGQEHVVRTLQNALNTGRTAHAYIFSGPRGTGKTTLARLLAKGLNCEQGPTGAWCNTCTNCQRIAKGHSVDVIEIDGASNRGIDEIRDVREKVKFAPAEGRFKVYIIDEIHMLTQEAFNALLKVLEEPPAHVVFIFATTEAFRIPATIVSRCQKFDFHGFSPDQVAEQVRRVAAAEGADIDDGAIHLIARHAAGGMRDALGFLDQCMSFAEEGITESLAAQVLGVVEQEQLEQLAQAVADQDLARCFMIVKSVADSGRDLRQFARDVVQYFRDLMLLKAAPGRDGLVVLWGDDLEKARKIADCFKVTELLRIVERLGQSEADMRWAQIVQLPLEMALIELLREEPETHRQPEPAPSQSVQPTASSPAPSPSTRPVPAQPATPQVTQPVAPTPQRTAASPRPADSSPIAPTPTPSPSAPSAPPVQPAVASGEPAGFLQRIQSEWPRVLDYLRTAKYIQQEAFLREGMPGAYANGVLTIYFSPNHRFHQANIAQEKNKDIVVQAIKKLFHEDVKLDVVLGEPPGGPPNEPTGGPAAEASGVSPEGEQQDAPKSLKPSESLPPPRAEETPVPSSPPPFPSAAQAESSAASTPVGGTETMNPDEVDDPLIKAALEMFGGTITRLEREGGS